MIIKYFRLKILSEQKFGTAVGSTIHNKEPFLGEGCQRKF